VKSCALDSDTQKRSINQSRGGKQSLAMRSSLVQRNAEHSLSLGTSGAMVQIPTMIINRWVASLEFEIIEVHVRTDVLLPAIVLGIVVPRGELACLESRPDEAALALGDQDGGSNGLHIPLGVCFGDKIGKDGGDFSCHDRVLGREGSEVDEFLGVRGEVVELVRVGGARDILPVATTDHHHWSDGAFTAVLSEDSV
jgi:hypothetical protein